MGGVGEESSERGSEGGREGGEMGQRLRSTSSAAPFRSVDPPSTVKVDREISGNETRLPSYQVPHWLQVRCLIDYKTEERSPSLSPVIFHIKLGDNHAIGVL